MISFFEFDVYGERRIFQHLNALLIFSLNCLMRCICCQGIEGISRRDEVFGYSSWNERISTLTNCRVITPLLRVLDAMEDSTFSPFSEPEFSSEACSLIITILDRWVSEPLREETNR